MCQGFLFFPFVFFFPSHPFPLPCYPEKLLSTFRRLGGKKVFKILIVHKNLILNSNLNPFQPCTYVQLVSSSPKFATVSLMPPGFIFPLNTASGYVISVLLSIYGWHFFSPSAHELGRLQQLQSTSDTSENLNWITLPFYTMFL